MVRTSRCSSKPTATGSGQVFSNLLEKRRMHSPSFVAGSGAPWKNGRRTAVTVLVRDEGARVPTGELSGSSSVSSGGGELPSGTGIGLHILSPDRGGAHSRSDLGERLPRVGRPHASCRGCRHECRASGDPRRPHQSATAREGSGCRAPHYTRAARPARTARPRRRCRRSW